MKKISMIFLTVTLFLLLPIAANARQGRISFLLEGGKAWGEALNGPLAAAKISLPLFGRLWLQGGYNHYFNPEVWNDPSGNKRSAFTLGLQYKSREQGRRLQWFVHCDGGSFRFNSQWYPDEFNSIFGFGLGGGIEKLLSDSLGMRFDLRAWSLFSLHSNDNAWVETSLGFFFRL